MQLFIDLLKALLYCAVIQFINYSFKLPAVFSILPLMLFLIAFMLFTREWKNKKRQYVFLITYVLEYFGFLLYFYDKGHLMPITALCMSAILTAWGVLCIECLTKDKKRNLIGFATLILVAVVAYLGIWVYYSAKAESLADKVLTAQAINKQLCEEADRLTTELNVVFYSEKDVVFSLKELADPKKVGSKDPDQLFEEYKAGISSADGKFIKALVLEGVELDHKLHEVTK